MNKYVEDCPCGNPYPHGVEFAGRYQFVCDKCGRKTKWFYERNNARYSWNRKIRYKRNKEKGVSMTTPTKEQIEKILSVAPVEDGPYVIPQIITEWEKIRNSPK